MQRLLDIQSAVRHAIVLGDDGPVAGVLAAGSNLGIDPKARLHIHRRHYVTSLVTALLEKFPATVWLIGSQFFTEAARRYVYEHPPQHACIAEYGESFPDFLADFLGTEQVPYLREFAQLEWHAGRVSIATDEVAISPEALRAVSDCLPDAVALLQPGLRYLRASWPVDELLELFLTDTAPDSLEFERSDVWLEIRGARGEFRIERLTPAEFAFRKSISAGRSIGDAAEAALEIEGGFDVGGAFAGLVASGLIVGIQPAHQELP
jgi:hypothetical protein